ncbi:MAG: glycoside hydrolase family 97 N-terminal domain-containing protein, partial [Prevotella sp.]|nr:glycoside hydrolase family 97 N-terminal domain-containing protein [Prevotella sp.]
MKRNALVMAALLCVAAAQANDVRVKSPNGSVEVTVSDAGGRLAYSIALDGRQMLAESALGLRTSIGQWTDGLAIVDTATKAIDKTYEMRNAKASVHRYQACELTLSLENKQRQPLTLTFRVADNDVAFRYSLPMAKGKSPYRRALILGEASSFNFPDGTTTFLSPQIGPETGWEHTKPSYEEVYTPDAPMTARSQYGRGYVYPCLFHLNPADDKSATAKSENDKSANAKSENRKSVNRKSDEAWVLISETGTTGRYCGTHLSDYEAGRGYTVAFPDKGENGSLGSEYVGVALPADTPWRTITLGKTLKPLVETMVTYDVVEPLYEPSEQYKPGRYTWSWLIWQDNATVYDVQVKFVDLAAAMGYEYCLVDGFWDTQIGRKRIEELSKYAQQKGVSLMLWYNSNGAWNDAPQGPRGCMDTSLARNREMKWMQQIGVKGIKVDFFGGDKQQTMQLYEDILADANRYGIQVIFHGCTLPRGWERMFPNYVASEAVLASENVYFTESAAQREAYDLTLHPF